MGEIITFNNQKRRDTLGRRLPNDYGQLGDGTIIERHAPAKKILDLNEACRILVIGNSA